MLTRLRLDQKNKWRYVYHELVAAPDMMVDDYAAEAYDAEAWDDADEDAINE